MQSLIISGLSGSGKTSVVKTLEDLGVYCVDNMPVSLLQLFFELIAQSTEEIKKWALVVDARDRQNIGHLPDVLEHISSKGYSITTLFLEASDDVLARRFSETRHRHPLAHSGSVLEGIQQEQVLLKPIREKADIIVDTTAFSVNDLRRCILHMFESSLGKNKMTITVSSFGYKHGLPLTADLVFDVRFLPNPFFRDDLKMKNGTDVHVVEYVMKQSETSHFLSELQRLFVFLIPKFEKESKSYLHIAIGCTGGKHRSVVIAYQLANLFKEMGYDVLVNHRDLEKS